MTAIARDNVAADHLVYAWPFPLGPECDVTCREDEQVVMCPSWIVGDRLGPGHHRWRTPDPTRPVAAYFVLVAPVEVSFDMTTSFILPMTGQPIRLRATGSLQVRCADPALLVAQFVGLPFDSVNEGVLRSVSRSIERMLARLLTRRVVMAGTPMAVTDASMKPQIIEELIAYNPAAGAVFGVELIRMGHLTIAADDGSSPYFLRVADTMNGNGHHQAPTTARGHTAATPTPAAAGITPRRTSVAPGEMPDAAPIKAVPTSLPEIKPPGPSQTTASGEIRSKTPSGNMPPIPKKDSSGGAQVATSSGEIVSKAAKPAEPKRAAPLDIVTDPSEITQPSMTTPLPGTMRKEDVKPASGSIMGIGMGGIGTAQAATPASATTSEAKSVASGEIAQKIKPGARVLVPGPAGLMQSATVRQLLQGYYELEVGSSGETIWVPINGVVPE